MNQQRILISTEISNQSDLISNDNERWVLSEKNYLVILLERARLIKITQQMFQNEYERELNNTKHSKTKNKIIKPEIKFKYWLKKKRLGRKQVSILLRRLEIVNIFLEAGLDDISKLCNLQLSHFDLLLDESIPEEFLYLCANFIKNELYDNFHPSILLPLINSSKVQLHPESTLALKTAVDNHNFDSSFATKILSIIDKINNEPEVKNIAKNELDILLQSEIITKPQTVKFLTKIKALQKIDQSFFLTSDIHSIDNIIDLLTETLETDSFVSMSRILSLSEEIVLLIQKILKKQQKLKTELDILYTNTTVGNPTLRNIQDKIHTVFVQQPITVFNGSSNLPMNLDCESDAIMTTPPIQYSLFE